MICYAINFKKKNSINNVSKFKKKIHDVFANKKFFFHNNNVKNYFNNNFEIKNNFLINVFFKIANFESKFELNFLFIFVMIVTFKKKKIHKFLKNRKFKINRFEFLLIFFNVYFDFYLTNVIREFKTIININVLTNEIKYIYVF